jgi:hypothetical protein
MEAMKKILVLLFSLGTITTVFAQNGYHGNSRQDSREVILGQGNGRPVYDNDRYDHGNMNTRERDFQIQRINQEFDARIWQVEHDRYLRKSDRKRQIRILEEQRRDAIRNISMRSYRRGGRY